MGDDDAYPIPGGGDLEYYLSQDDRGEIGYAVGSNFLTEILEKRRRAGTDTTTTPPVNRTTNAISRPLRKPRRNSKDAEKALRALTDPFAKGSPKQSERSQTSVMESPGVLTRSKASQSRISQSPVLNDSLDAIWDEIPATPEIKNTQKLTPHLPRIQSVINSSTPTSGLNSSSRTSIERPKSTPHRLGHGSPKLSLNMSKKVIRQSPLAMTRNLISSNTSALLFSDLDSDEETENRKEGVKLNFDAEDEDLADDLLLMLTQQAEEKFASTKKPTTSVSETQRQNVPKVSTTSTTNKQLRMQQVQNKNVVTSSARSKNSRSPTAKQGLKSSPPTHCSSSSQSSVESVPSANRVYTSDEIARKRQEALRRRAERMNTIKK